MSVHDLITPDGRPAMISISVVVCTYNRSELLKRALDTLVAQKLSKAFFEIIVVDNNSKDHTKEVVADYSSRHPEVRYCFESRQGLSNARNRGFREARGRYTGYFDDDSEAPKEWLAIALDILETRKPEIFGGPYYPLYPAPKPQWLLDKYNSRTHGAVARALGPEEFLSGTNIFIRRDVLEALKGFDTTLGMTGDSLGYGEETAFIMAAWREIPDLQVFYDPRLYVFHLVAPCKMRLTWNAGQSFADGRCATRMIRPRSRRGWSTLLSVLKCIGFGGAFAMACAIGTPLRNRTRYPFPRNYFMEHSFRILRQIGKAYEEILIDLGRTHT